MKSITLFFLVCLPIISSAGNDNRPAGARAAGMGKASAALIDIWSSFHNQAALALLQKKSAAVSYENRFRIKELSTKAFCFNIPTKAGTFAANYTQYGFDLYKESKIGIAYAKALGKHFWAGIQFNRQSKKIQMENGSQSRYTFEAGILTEIIPNLFIGFHIFNPMQTAFEMEEYEDKIPASARLGASYQLTKRSLITCEISKDFDGSASLKIGAEYAVTSNIYIRAGTANHPNSISLGLGFKYAQFNTNIAFSRHTILGYTPSVDLSFKF